MKNYFKVFLSTMIPLLIGVGLGLTILYRPFFTVPDTTEETMDERIERYKDFPEKDGSESLFIDTRYIIRSC